LHWHREVNMSTLQGQIQQVFDKYREVNELCGSLVHNKSLIGEDLRKIQIAKESAGEMVLFIGQEFDVTVSKPIDYSAEDR
ncbi:MAG: hypothetical protein OXE50_16600, partial [Chloroflexi bacterium]|nr:hypothetical protein [Chloroflexota bacterium]